ncbi:MAG: GIY-YIG nuclease family protein [Paludibacter sp.]|jgi:predicted GIY-YIG superfamily endonuclease|nr:GIY-YIG nuclease family protein [Paludibacter sp.]
MEKEKQYIYIVQASLEPSKCKIGKTSDLERRVSEYNNMTGKSKENTYRYLFSCAVKDMAQVEKDIKDVFQKFREDKKKEIYFFNDDLFEEYVKFIKSHNLFIEDIFIKIDDKKPIVKIVKKTTPTLKERGLSSPKDLMQKAQKRKNDEFYTRYEDIEKEISMYAKEIWKDKIVFCNCDDAVDEKNGKINEKRTSAFALYFINNFKNLGLKKLICTHYSGPIDLFNAGSKGLVYLITYEVGEDGRIKIEKQSPKGYTGSFDDPLSLKILNEEADIVCTNPPFSRAADYWKTIIKSKKKFLIISNISNIVTNSFIPYFYYYKVWAGYNRVDWFEDDRKRLIDASGHWYTNLPITNRPKYEHLKIMHLDDIPAKYKKDDDSKILLVDNCYIPDNYHKPFAVSARPILNGLLEKGYCLIENKEYYPYINGKKCFARVLVQKM